MNYIKLINQFWRLRRSKRITSKQADLYFFLIQECNEQNWENPFECSNKLIIASIDIQEPTLIDARNRLKQYGLIEFQAGKRNEASPVYQILYLNGLSRNRDESLDESLVETEQRGSLIKQTKRKQNSSKSHSGGEPPARKKKAPEEKTEYWKVLVKIWFDFYGEKFKNEDQTPAAPIFNGTQGEHLSKIAGFLKKLATGKQYTWDEAYAGKCLKGFLSKAFTHDDWIRNNFELGNLVTKFNSITNSKQHGNDRKINSQGSRADSVRTGQDIASDILAEQLTQLEPGRAGNSGG